MGDDREQDGDPRDDEPGRFDGDEDKGIGLTEEFARLEREIERELGPPPGDLPGAGEPASSRQGGESSADADADADEPPGEQPAVEPQPDPGPQADELELEGDGDDAQEPGRGEVRFDETDSSEWVVPAPPPDAEQTTPAGGETEEWDVEAEADEAGDASEGDAALEVGAAPEDDLVGGDEAGAEGEEAGSEQPADPPTEIHRPEDDEPEDESAVDEAALAGVAAAAAPPGESPIEHTVVRQGPPPGAGPPITGGYYYEEEDLENKTPALWWRFLTASILIVASVATAVAVSSLIFITGVAADLQPIEGIGDRLADIEPGDPQTIMIVGSDKRAGTPGDPGRSDTTMLLRVDPENEVLSLLSIPRDLKVQIPGALGETKFNEAFAMGGVKKTLETVKDLTGLEISNVVNVDFNGFAKAVDAINCVYVDVDRRYFNDNSTALSEADTYAAIHVNAGYQRLCGQKALDYVRYRHTDNDFVRGARQQDFLRNARAQVPISDVLPILEGSGGEGSKLLKIFTDHTQSNIDSAAKLIDVLKTFVSVRNVPINEVHLDAIDVMENGVSYVVAEDEAIEQAVDEFLGGAGTAGPRGGDVARSGSSADDDAAKKEKKKKKKRKKEKDPRKGANVISTADLAAITDGIDNFEKFGRTSARRLKFPVWIPTVVATDSTFSADSRQYEIKDPDDDKHPAYKMVIQHGTGEGVVEYYGVQGTSWSDPPILRDPSETRTIGGRDYELFYDGDRLRLVAFQDDDGNSYWVSNTLLQSLGEGEMLAIATSMEESHG